eukprot:4037708-Amphidinium_carterae.1
MAKFRATMPETAGASKARCSMRSERQAATGRKVLPTLFFFAPMASLMTWVDTDFGQKLEHPMSRKA